jgi:hypothetical protein
MLQEIIAEPEIRSLHNLNLYSEIFYSNVIVDAVNMFQNPMFIRTFSHLSYRTSHSEPLEIPTSHKVSVLASLWKITSSTTEQKTASIAPEANTTNLIT